jgi:hypothetical protein
MSPLKSNDSKSPSKLKMLTINYNSSESPNSNLFRTKDTRYNVNNFTLKSTFHLNSQDSYTNRNSSSNNKDFLFRSQSRGLFKRTDQAPRYNDYFNNKNNNPSDDNEEFLLKTTSSVSEASQNYFNVKLNNSRKINERTQSSLISSSLYLTSKSKVRKNIDHLKYIIN